MCGGTVSNNMDIIIKLEVSSLCSKHLAFLEKVMNHKDFRRCYELVLLDTRLGRMEFRERQGEGE